MPAILRNRPLLTEILVILSVVIAAYPALLMVIESKIKEEMAAERQYMLEFLARVAETKPAAVEKAIESAASNELPELD